MALHTVAAGVPLADVKAYLESIDAVGSWSDQSITDVLNAEAAAQSNSCRYPVVDGVPVYSTDLVEAIKRRVAHNLALRTLPLGLQSSMSETTIATTRVGGLDAEVRRFEAPWRKRVVG